MKTVYLFSLSSLLFAGGVSAAQPVAPAARAAAAPPLREQIHIVHCKEEGGACPTPPDAPPPPPPPPPLPPLPSPGQTAHRLAQYALPPAPPAAPRPPAPPVPPVPPDDMHPAR